LSVFEINRNTHWHFTSAPILSQAIALPKYRDIRKTSIYQGLPTFENLIGPPHTSQASVHVCVFIHRSTKMWSFSAYSILFVLTVSFANAEKETLVLLDNLAIRETHSIFFKSLTGNLKKCWADDVPVSKFWHQPVNKNFN
jgi:hypothetical protein